MRARRPRSGRGKRRRRVQTESRSAGVSPASSNLEGRGPRGWHNRGYLPHFDGGEVTQSLTIRLWDSLPKKVFERIVDGLNREKLQDETQIARRKQELIERCLDRGFGSCLLKNPAAAELVQNALLYFDGQRYRL